METFFLKSLHDVQFCLLFRKKKLWKIFLVFLKTQFPLQKENIIEINAFDLYSNLITY